MNVLKVEWSGELMFRLEAGAATVALPIRWKCPFSWGDLKPCVHVGETDQRLVHTQKTLNLVGDHDGHQRLNLGAEGLELALGLVWVRGEGMATGAHEMVDQALAAGVGVVDRVYQSPPAAELLRERAVEVNVV